MYPTIGNSSFVSVKPDPRIREITERRIAATRKMTDALFEYLTFSDQVTLDTFDDPPAVIPYEYHPSPEQLVEAVRQRDSTQGQIEMLEQSLNSDMINDVQVGIIEATMLTPLRVQLEQQNTWISKLQAELEKQQSPT